MIEKIRDKIVDSLVYSELPADERDVWDVVGEENYKILKARFAGLTLHFSCIFSHRNIYKRVLEEELEVHPLGFIATQLYTTKQKLKRVLEEG